jgi:hypothetical protein
MRPFGPSWQNGSISIHSARSNRRACFVILPEITAADDSVTMHHRGFAHRTKA